RSGADRRRRKHRRRGRRIGRCARGAVDFDAVALGGVKTDKVVGTMYMDSPAGRGFSDPQHGLPPILKKYDYKEVPTGYFQITNDDFSNQIAAMKAGGASIIPAPAIRTTSPPSGIRPHRPD